MSTQTASLPKDTQKELLGYLNFSSGNRDPKFLLALDALFEYLSNSKKKDVGHPALQAIAVLEEQLKFLARESEAFHVDDQAGLVLALVREHFFTEYRQFHALLCIVPPDYYHHYKTLLRLPDVYIK